MAKASARRRVRKWPGRLCSLQCPRRLLLHQHLYQHLYQHQHPYQHPCQHPHSRQGSPTRL